MLEKIIERVLCIDLRRDTQDTIKAIDNSSLIYKEAHKKTRITMNRGRFAIRLAGCICAITASCGIYIDPDHALKYGFISVGLAVGSQVVDYLINEVYFPNPYKNLKVTKNNPNQTDHETN